MNGQDDSWFTKDYYPEMKWKSTLVRTWILLYVCSVFIGASVVGGFCPIWSSRDPDSKDPPSCDYITWNTQSPLSSHHEERVQEYLTPMLVCFSLSHKLESTLPITCGTHTSLPSSRPLLRDFFILLWDNSIPFRHSIELKSSNFWIHNSPYIRCEYSLSWSGNFDVKIQVICFSTLPLSFNTHTQYSSRKGKLVKKKKKPQNFSCSEQQILIFALRYFQK